jgi:hypothetical protein
VTPHCKGKPVGSAIAYWQHPPCGYRWKNDPIGRKVLRVKRFDLVSTPTGLKVVAIGFVAIWFSLLAFTFCDFWILFTGDLPRLSLYGIWYLLLGGLAALFSAMCVVLWQPAFARLIAALFSVSMASHVLERIVRISTPELRVISVGRLLVSLGVVLVYFRYRVD